MGDLGAAVSRSINIQYMLVYQVLESERVVKVLRLSVTETLRYLYSYNANLTYKCRLVL